MSNTTSLAFPNMFNISQNKVAVLEDNKSVVNRTRLLMLSNPTEMYNDTQFGLGLYKHMWQYNNENQKSIIVDRLKEQLRLYEPYCYPDETSYSSGLLFTGSTPEYKATRYDQLEMTISVQTTFADKVAVKVGTDDIYIE